MRTHAHDQRRTDPAATPRRDPEAQPVNVLLALQRSAGNRAVRTLMARQPSPSRQRASTSTLGLGDVIGVIPLESAQTGEADHDGNIHDLTVTFVGNAVVPKLNEMHAKGARIDEGFYSSTAMKLTLKGIYITSMTVTGDHEGGGEIVSLTLNCASIVHEKAP